MQTLLDFEQDIIDAVVCCFRVTVSAVSSLVGPAHGLIAATYVDVIYLSK